MSQIESSNPYKHIQLKENEKNERKILQYRLLKEERNNKKVLSIKTRVKKKQRNKERKTETRKKERKKNKKEGRIRLRYFIEKQGKGLYQMYLIKNIFSTKTIKLKQKQAIKLYWRDCDNNPEWSYRDKI